MAANSNSQKPLKCKSGRVIASNGYVLIRVGKDHHLADVRGYAYEHRLVAEETLGRRLDPGEQVHHKDENKQNNARDNLIVVRGIAEHLVHHRKPGCKRQLPGEDNPLIQCACGCGESLQKFDGGKRPRQYISGHNPQATPSLSCILAALQHGPQTRHELALLTRMKVQTVAIVLSKLKRRGSVENIDRGVWRLANG